MANPFYRILIQDNQRDITNLVENFRYEESVEEDDLVRFNVRAQDPSIVDDEDLQEGKRLIFSFGLKNRQSGKRIAQISDIDVSFQGTIRMAVTALDLGMLLKKESRRDLWDGKTSSEIAIDIANRNGLKHNVEATSRKHTFMPQSNKTDFEFLQYLAGIEENGSFRFFVKDDVLNFNKIDLRQDSQRTFRYNFGNGNVISFAPKKGETKKDPSSRETKIAGIDPVTGEESEETVNNQNATDDAKLGDYPVYYNSNSERLNNIGNSEASKEQDSGVTGKNIVQPSEDLSEAKNRANKLKKDSAMKDITGSLKLSGDPFYEPDTIITISNVGNKYSGNWYVCKVTHTISVGAPYVSMLSLKKNATKRQVTGNSERSSDTNNSNGPEEGNEQKKVEIFRFDQNSVRVE